MKKFFLLLLVVVLGVALYRRLSSSRAAGRHQHGTPDHWPTVVRKPTSDEAPAA